MKIKKENVLTIIAFVGVFTFLFSFMLKNRVTNLDEIWNFNISNQMANGLVPYKDISMITTPFLASVIAIFLKITSNELIVFRILTALIATLICFFTYKIFDVVIKRKIVSAILTGLMITVLYDFFALDYNFGVLLINLIIVFIELKNMGKETSKAHNIIIGILAMIAVLTKQTVGLFIALEVVLFKLISIGKKEDVSTCLKQVLFRIVGMIIPAIVFGIYLIATNSFVSFIDYTIKGISTFSNSVPYTNLFESTDLIVKISAILNPIFLLIAIIVSIMNRNKHKEYGILTIGSIAMLIVVYPIADSAHHLISVFVSIILFLYLIYQVSIYVYKKIKWDGKRYIVMSLKSFLILVLIAEGTINIYRNFNEYYNANKNTALAHYKYLIIDDVLTKRINDIMEFEKEKNDEGIEVYILDSEAAVHHIVQNKYYKNYDMFNKGNFGGDGEDGIIEDIKQSQHCIYLIKNEKYKMNWQTPTVVTDYVRENLEYQGEINMYSIYYKE